MKFELEENVVVVMSCVTGVVLVIAGLICMGNASNKRNNETERMKIQAQVITGQMCERKGQGL